MKLEKVIVKDESEIESRKNREVKVVPRLKSRLTQKEILEALDSSKNKKVIAICNTVERTQILYRELKKRGDVAVYLLHSRFLDGDRANLERKLQTYFGKSNTGNSSMPTVFIATQVVEVGMDISADILVTEISPIDSLIQRAGRCARWGGKGEVYVFDVDKPAPYETDLVKDTKKVLEKKSITLDWITETRLVNQILGRHFEKYLNLGLMYEILGVLSRAAYGGERKAVEKAVREISACDLSLHSNPETLGDDVWRLPRVRVDSRVLQSKFCKTSITLWRIDEDVYWSDYRSKFHPRQIKNKDEILPFRFYVANPRNVSYNSNEGLIFDYLGKDFELTPEVIMANRPKKGEAQHCESWIEHSRKILHVFDTDFVPRFDFVLDRFSRALQLRKDELLSLMRVAIGLHDIGKLNVEWQLAIGWKKGEEPVAHCYFLTQKHLPPHATVSAISLQRIFAPFGKSLWKSFLLAIAHHHAPRARECPAFRMVGDYASVIEKVELDVDTRNILPIGRATSLPSFIDIRGTQNLYYRLYSLLSKYLRLSDWIASGEGIYESLFHS
jgi:CRISPR-associated endonuclease/helicase Cas3